MTSGLLEENEEDDDEEFNEMIIKQCGMPMPNEYFCSDDFLDVFENQCNQVSRHMFYFFTVRAHLRVRTSYS